MCEDGTQWLWHIGQYKAEWAGAVPKWEQLDVAYSAEAGLKRAQHYSQLGDPGPDILVVKRTVILETVHRVPKYK